MTAEGTSQAARLRLATRGSALALAQTRIAAAALRAAGAASTEELVIRTRGDREASTPAALMEGTGWFTSELERALLEGRAEVAVHSAKDLPTELLGGLRVAAHLPRADARDALVTAPGGASCLAELRAGARVGTSSLRRLAWLHAARPDLRVEPIRGNVDTRLRKLDQGLVDALLLACAGLDRLGLGDRITERLDPLAFVPAPAQGAVALEVRSGGDAEAAVALADDAATSVAVAAERAVLRALGGGCRLPLGAHARLHQGRLVLVAALGIDGGAVRRAQLDGDPAGAAELGARLAELLRG